jgi:hypothetical protein
MDRTKQRDIASKGGRAAHQKGTAHEWTSEEAREAGRKGGMASHRRRQQQSGDESVRSYDSAVGPSSGAGEQVIGSGSSDERSDSFGDRDRGMSDRSGGNDVESPSGETDRNEYH